ncbi:MAG TPA: cytochrome P450, partial [Aggregicoccus sp.]|nr:cytochrome P450 [Aggregicoccus sp.]
AAREAPRRAAVTALTGLQPQALQEHTAQAAAQLAPRMPTDGAALDTFALSLPVHVTAALLGIAPAALPRMVRCTWALVSALSPLATAREREAGNAALEPLLSALADARGGPLLQTFRHHARGEGTQEQVVLANAVGFLIQSCEATAGLIGNALLALGQDAQLLAQVRACRALLPTLLEEVLRYDPPVQNTRRYVAEDLTLCGAQLEAGQTVLLLLAAANRDPALNPEPQRFQLQREQRRHLTFGLGAHACPGSRLATTVAAAALEQLLERGVDPAQWASTRRYRASLNGRIPLFCAPAASATEGGRA